MCFCPFHTTASVWIHMHAANLAPIQFSCSFLTSQLPIPSMTATAHENSTFGIRLVRLNPSFTWDAQSCFETFSLVVLVTAPIWACCTQARQVFSSSSRFLPFILLIGGTLCTVGHQSMVLEANTKKKSVHDLKPETRMTLRFARARTTTRGTKHPQQWRHIAFAQSLVGCLYPFFFNLDALVRLRSHVYLFYFHVFQTYSSNDRSQIQVRALTPETFAGLAVQCLQW